MVETSTKARQTVLGYGTKVWFQMPAAATSCHTMKKTITDSSGQRGASQPAAPLFLGAADAGEPTCGSSGAISTNTDTVSDFLLAEGWTEKA